jgi:hypothetical protein
MYKSWMIANLWSRGRGRDLLIPYRHWIKNRTMTLCQALIALIPFLRDKAAGALRRGDRGGRDIEVERGRERDGKRMAFWFSVMSHLLASNHPQPLSHPPA